MLKWNKRFMQYESNKSLEETIGAFEGYVGCVYPNDESSYFICSGGRMKLSYVQCTDGGFYGERRVCRMLCDGEYVMPEPSKRSRSYCRCFRKEITRRFKTVGGYDVWQVKQN